MRSRIDEVRTIKDDRLSAKVQFKQASKRNLYGAGVILLNSSFILKKISEGEIRKRKEGS